MNRRSLAAATLLSLAPACIFVVDAKHDLGGRPYMAAGWAHPAAMTLAADLDELGWEVERFAPRGELWRYEVAKDDQRATLLVALRAGDHYHVRELRGDAEELEGLLGHDDD